MTLRDRDWAALQLMGVAPWPRRPAAWVEGIETAQAAGSGERPSWPAPESVSSADVLGMTPGTDPAAVASQAVQQSGSVIRSASTQAKHPDAAIRPTGSPARADGADEAAAASAAGAGAALSRVDLSALDWVELRETVAACQACGLCESRRQTVFGVGSTQAHWMIVGEAPGEQEDLKGEPFVGPAGQLLDRMLAAIDLTRAETSAEGEPALSPKHQVYVANTLKCRPPRNRNPEPEELARCEPYLHRQIELLRPRLILAMGRFAVQRLLRTDEAIGRLRGRVHQYQDIPVIVTYHPAYLLRNPIDKAKAWADLCLAAETMTSPAPLAGLAAEQV